MSGSVKVASDNPIGGMLRFDLSAIGKALVGASHPSAMQSSWCAAGTEESPREL